MDVTFGPNQAGAKCDESFDRAQLKREGDGADKVKVSMPVKDVFAVSGLFSVQMAMVVIGRSLWLVVRMLAVIFSQRFVLRMIRKISWLPLRSWKRMARVLRASS